MWCHPASFSHCWESCSAASVLHGVFFIRHDMASFKAFQPVMEGIPVDRESAGHVLGLVVLAVLFRFHAERYPCRVPIGAWDDLQIAGCWFFKSRGRDNHPPRIPPEVRLVNVRHIHPPGRSGSWPWYNRSRAGRG